MASRQANTAELEALVQQLRQELADKDRLIAQLQSQLGQFQAGADAGESSPPQPPRTDEEATPGSQADLLSQLDKLYQEK